MPDVKSQKAEVKVFDAIRDGLSDEWEAYHSASWLVRDPAEGSDDGEIDFVLCHPEHGIVCLEVKGGGLECRFGEWYRLKDGQRERAKDPFGQALDHRWDLDRKIRKVDDWKKHKLFIAHGLVFTDITVHKLALPPDADDEIVIDRNEVDQIAAGVERIIKFHRGARDKRELPGTEGADMLRALLAPDVLIRVPLATHIMDEEAELQRMTLEQASLLARHGRSKRMAIYGCAGSGKTMIAVEQARRAAERGERVLFVCFNVALRDHLRERVKVEGLEFWNFHALATHLAYKGGAKLTKYDRGKAPQSYWNEDLPEAMVSAIDELGPQFDSIFVDEAQDLRNEWLDALLFTLEDPDKGQVWLFLDSNQRVYDAKLDVPDEYHPFELTVNCRNTQAIHKEVAKYFDGPVAPEVSGPEGREIEFYKAEDQAGTVAAIVNRLVTEEEIPPQDITVLSAYGFDKSPAAAVKLAGGLSYAQNPPAVGKHVRFSSIRAFKGLESPVVVLCELDHLEEETEHQQIYVALSRARNHCVVVAPAPADPDG